MSSLDIYIVTLNCGRALVDTNAFAAHLFKPYHDHASEGLPDVVVLNVQEVAPIAYSFLGGSFLQPYFARIVESVQHASPQIRYRKVASHNAGMTAIIVLVKQDIAENLEWTGQADVGVGLWEMGNKGAAGVRLAYAAHGSAGVELTFVAAHLAAGEESFDRRNLDFENIVRRLTFLPSKHYSAKQANERAAGDEHSEVEPLLAENGESSNAASGMYGPRSVLFFGGDLNYRTSDKGPGNTDHRSFPQPTYSVGDKKHYAHLLQHDQLGREKKAGKTLLHLAEAPIHFPPTYKYSPEYYQRSPPQAHGAEVEPSTWHWASHRYPSWCDRVLFSSYLLEAPASLKVLAYAALPIQPTTDHRPVALAVRFGPNQASQAMSKYAAEYTTPFPLNAQATNLRAAARRREVIVGILAYLGWTWEGNGILLATTIGALGGWLIIRSLLSN